MKKYLIRGEMSPVKEYSVEHIIANDQFAGNVGNLLYMHAAFRTLLTKDTVIDMDHYCGDLKRYSDADIDRINETYDGYIIPLADAFREDFIRK